MDLDASACFKTDIDPWWFEGVESHLWSVQVHEASMAATVRFLFWQGQCEEI